ncbi:MAG TPA: chaperone modulator CbpM [Salinivirga sp.]|uniref:chaperone modulator CbpM n=1 Tax=Salinivirga sp. TaxID=1970192 RepID=UPI002B46EB59|nr:chaperone modulator CbpM [Salinivirga sp.]HKK59273.1 chaperone modulator CbpM [Salinivirga sp.]
MSENQYITIEELCQLYEIEAEFIEELKENELIQVVQEDEKTSVPVTEIQNIEKIQSFYYDLEINIAGIDAIFNLLNQIDEMKREMNDMKRKLDFLQNNSL